MLIAKRKQRKNFDVEHTVLLHDSEELDDDLGAWSDQDLSLSSFLGIVDALKAIVQDRGSDHFGGLLRISRFSSRVSVDLRYLRSHLR